MYYTSGHLKFITLLLPNRGFFGGRGGKDQANFVKIYPIIIFVIYIYIFYFT